MSCGVSQYGNKSVYTAAPAVATMATVEAMAKLRIIHNVAGGPEVDGYLDGVNVLQNFSYKSITDYLKVKSGMRTVTVKAAGTNNIIVEGGIELAAGGVYTLIVHGLIANPKTIAPLLLSDDLTCPVQGKAHVRFVHAAAGAPAVDIYGNGMKVFSNVSYGEIGNPQYLPVNVGKLEVEVAPAGKNVLVLGPIPLNLHNKGVYTIIASGLLNDGKYPLTALVSEDTKGSCVIMNM
jgi:hypothetical protein